MRIGLIILLAFALNQVQAQLHDTLRVMSYNLLYYGQVTSFCTSSNNNINDKDGYFETVASYIKPDLLVVNEMGASNIYGDRIIANVLNTNGETRFARANIQNNSFSNLVNAVFYDKNKLALYRTEKVEKALNNSSLVRVIDVWTFYYKDPNLTQGSDTAFIHLAGMHLKAGSNASDAVDRGLATEALMDYLETEYQPGYFIAAGDMNMKSSNETAYQNLTDNAFGAYRFYDPLFPNESWSGASSFAFSHTQSTRTSGGCFAGGGLDDRFDIMLMSEQLMEDSAAVHYIDNSYKAVGNDGNHYNMSLIDGNNNSAPSTVLAALYDMSDHLPVIADISVRLIETPVDTSDSLNGLLTRIDRSNNWQMYVYDQQVEVQHKGTEGIIQVRDLSGRLVLQLNDTKRTSRIDLSNLNAGFYIITGVDASSSLSRKVFVRN